MTKVVIKAADGTGAVESYHNANKKLETTSAGVTVTGNIAVTGTVDGRDLATDGTKLDGVAASATSVGGATGVDFNDNVKVRFGTGNDFEIFHDGTLNRFQSSGLKSFQFNPKDTDVGLKIIGDGGVELYYDNVQQFKTTSTGVYLPNTNATLDMPDNGKIRLGQDIDASIWHDGSNSWITNTTGSLFIKSDNAIKFQDAGGNEDFLSITDNGAVELYYDNSKKLETTNAGVKITGSLGLQMNACDVYIDDGRTVTFGGSNDLQIWHNATNSYIKNITGRLDVSSTSYLYLESDDRVYIGNVGMTEVGATYVKDGAFILNYDNSTKFETTSSGVTVTGNLDIGSVQLNGGGLALADNDKVICGSGDDLQIYHDGSHSFIKDSGTGNLHLDSVAGSVKIRTNTNEDSLVCNQDGAVELYYDNSKKFETNAYGTVTNGHSYLFDGHKVQLGSSQDLEIYHDSHNYIKGTTSGQYTYLQNTNGNIIIQAKAGEDSIWCGPDGDVELYYDGSKKLETTSGGITVTGSVSTNDINLSNLNAPTANEVDSTRGSWTIQEGSNDLFLINRSNGKKYKFNLTEVS